MNKIYLLLRNNKQTGPYNIEELGQLSLKTTDLIWVEGKSAGWRNPIEIDALKSYLPDSIQPNVQTDKLQIEIDEVITESQPVSLIKDQ